MAKPGWFTDDNDQTLARWFDGEQWTDHTVVKAEWPGPGMPPPPAEDRSGAHFADPFPPAPSAQPPAPGAPPPAPPGPPAAPHEAPTTAFPVPPTPTPPTPTPPTPYPAPQTPPPAPRPSPQGPPNAAPLGAPVPPTGTPMGAPASAQPGGRGPVDLGAVTALPLGDKLVAGGGILLFISTFFAWFKITAGGTTLGTGNAWDLGFIWWFLPTVLGLGAAALVLVPALSSVRVPDLPLSRGRILLAAGALAFLVVLVKLIIGVDDEGAGVLGIEVSRSFGIFLALLAAALLAAGGFLAFQAEGGDLSSLIPKRGGGSGGAGGPGSAPPPAGPPPGYGPPPGPPPSAGPGYGNAPSSPPPPDPYQP